MIGKLGRKIKNMMIFLMVIVVYFVYVFYSKKQFQQFEFNKQLKQAEHPGNLLPN